MKYRFYYLSVFIALLFSSCNKTGEKIGEKIEPGEAYPFSFSVQINNPISQNSKSVIGKTTFPDGEQLALFFTKDPAVSDQTVYFKRSIYQVALGQSGAQTWSPAKGASALSLYSQDANIYAIYPSNSTFTIATPEEPDAVPTMTPTHLSTANMGNLVEYTMATGGVAVDETVVKIFSEEIDYMAGKGATTLKPANPSTTVSMNHLMAMVAIRLKKDPSYLGPGLMTQFNIRNTTDGAKPLKSGTINLTTHAFTPGSDEVSYHRTFENHKLDDNVGALIYPATCPAGSLTISLLIDGEYYDIKNEAEIVFEKGKLTVIELNVMSNKLYINNTIMVNGWPDITTEHPFELE